MRPIGFALLAVAVAMSLTLVGCGGAPGGPVPKISAADPTLGKADAPVEVIEYASAACSHCAAFAADVFPAFKAKYIDTGQVHYAMRELLYPPEYQDFAAAGFLLARCAPAGKFFDVLDGVFRAQKATGDLTQRGALLQVALSSGMTEPQFNACVSDTKSVDALNKRVVRNMADTRKPDGTQMGTPIFYVGGKHRFPEGEATLDLLDKAIADSKAGK